MHNSSQITLCKQAFECIDPCYSNGYVVFERKKNRSGNKNWHSFANDYWY